MKLHVLFLLSGLFGAFQALAASPLQSLPSSWTSCTADSDCILVGTGCDGCCHYNTTVNRRSQALYEATLAKQCEGYHGAVCDCVPSEPTVPACRKNVCQLCAASANGAWFHARITWRAADLPKGMGIRTTHLSSTPFDADLDLLAAATPVYILGPLSSDQMKMKKEFEDYRQSTAKRLAQGLISKDTYQLDLQSYAQRMRTYADIGTPWEAEDGLVRRVTIEGDHAFRYSPPSPAPRYADDFLLLKSLPGIVAASGKDRPEKPKIPADTEFTLPLLWDDKIYRIRGRAHYTLNRDYQACR